MLLPFQDLAVLSERLPIASAKALGVLLGDGEVICPAFVSGEDPRRPAERLKILHDRSRHALAPDRALRVHEVVAVIPTRRDQRLHRFGSA